MIRRRQVSVIFWVFHFNWSLYDLWDKYWRGFKLARKLLAHWLSCFEPLDGHFLPESIFSPNYVRSCRFLIATIDCIFLYDKLGVDQNIVKKWIFWALIYDISVYKNWWFVSWLFVLVYIRYLALIVEKGEGSQKSHMLYLNWPLVA